MHGGAATSPSSSSSSPSQSSPGDGSSAYNLAAPISPDPRLTPGDTLDVTKQDICTPGYSKKVRNVPQSVKEEAYREYGITSRLPGEYEIDHDISLELGGSNSLKNLWPESFQTQPWNAHVKDALENKLHEMICSGQIDIKVAQREIASDWIASYKKYVGPEPAGHSAHKAAHGAEANSEIMSGVKNSGKNENSHSGGAAAGAERATAKRTSAGNVVETGTALIGNKKSHIYHRPDCPDYLKISPANRVEFKSTAEAESAGYRLAGNCPKQEQ